MVSPNGGSIVYQTRRGRFFYQDFPISRSGLEKRGTPNFLRDIEIPIPDEILLRVNKQKRKVRFHTCNKITGRMISENKISKVS